MAQVRITRIKESSVASSRIYFVVSCARSGSTSLANILDTAAGGRCLVEPMPNFNAESRDLMEGRIVNPRAILARDMMPRIAEALDQGQVYGEKNVTLGPFIPCLHEMLRCRFVFLTRDGRDVATSLMNWHNEAFGTIYRECRDPGPLSKRAEGVAATLSIEDDTSDYSRPRPPPGDPLFARWAGLSRFEMVSWYWNRINQLYLDRLASIPDEDWIQIDYTNVSSRDIAALFEFLELEGFDEGRTSEMLTRRINSVWDRFQMETRFPSWDRWDETTRRQFDRMALPMMKRLGYHQEGRLLEEPRKQTV